MNTTEHTLRVLLGLNSEKTREIIDRLNSIGQKQGKTAVEMLRYLLMNTQTRKHYPLTQTSSPGKQRPREEPGKGSEKSERRQILV